MTWLVSEMPRSLPTLTWQELRVLQVIYETFDLLGSWPVFQHVNAKLWHEFAEQAQEDIEPRDLYYAVSDRGLVRPAIQRDRSWELRTDTPVALTLRGLTEIGDASGDLGNYINALRYIGGRAQRFRPSDPTATEDLRVSGEEVRLALDLEQRDMALLRVARLLNAEASGIWTSFSGPDERGLEWSLAVDAEIARRYRNVVTVTDVETARFEISRAYAPSAMMPMMFGHTQQSDERQSTPSDTAELSTTSSNERPEGPVVFISYSHRDQEFVLALVDQLRQHRVQVWIDTKEMVIGDSLVTRIGDAIQDGDFVVGVISQHSINSPWCQKELALAETQGINAKRVKVLPVKLGDVVMPSFLDDAVWGEANDPATLALELARAIRTHLARSSGETADVSEPPETSEQATPTSDVAGALVRLDQIAERTDELLVQWDRCRQYGGPSDDLVAEQRRLRTLLTQVSPPIGDALRLVGEIANATWKDHFRVQTSAEAEPELREEIRAVRAQLTAGLPVVLRWRIDGEGEQVSAGNRDAVAYRWSLARGAESQRVTVFISGTALASANAGLPPEVSAAKETHGRSVVFGLLGLQKPPEEVLVATDGIRWGLP
jgi:hypothetical protein